MFVFNARSLSNKKDLGEFELIFRSCKYNIVAVCETWLNKSSPDSLLDASGEYAVFRQDRAGRGGGTAVLLENLKTLSFTVSMYLISLMVLNLLF